MTAHISEYAGHMQELHANQAMFAKLMQDHMAALNNLATATQLDRRALITLMATNVSIMQQLIDINLKLRKSTTEVARLKSASPDQAQTSVPAAFYPSGYCWSHGYKVCVGYNSSTCMTKNEGHKGDATQVDVKGPNEYNKTWAA